MSYQHECSIGARFTKTKQLNTSPSSKDRFTKLVNSNHQKYYSLLYQSGHHPLYSVIISEGCFMIGIRVEDHGASFECGVASGTKTPLLLTLVESRKFPLEVLDLTT